MANFCLSAKDGPLQSSNY